MFIENIIESLPDDKCLCLAKHLGIEENRAFIAKKKLIKINWRKDAGWIGLRMHTPQPL